MAQQRGKYQTAFNVTLGVVGLLVIVLTIISLGQTLIEHQAVSAQLASSQATYNQLVETNRQAQQEYNQVLDEAYLAEVARKDYYYSKPGEIIFDLGESANNNQSVADEAAAQ